ncbi:MAG: heme exporter protein CcmB, partial [Terriglobia bacterium]
MEFARRVATILWKDIILELRTKEILSSMFVFAMMAMIIFNFTLELRKDNVDQIAPGVLWIAFIFSGVLGLTRSFVLEKEKESILGLMLTPVDRSAIYLGKVVANVIFMFAVEAVILPVFAVFFNYSFLPVILPLVTVILLGTIGFVAVGTIFSAMSVNTRMREVLLPVLLFPVMVPVIIASVRSTSLIIQGGPLFGETPWVSLLIAFD